MEGYRLLFSEGTVDGGESGLHMFQWILRGFAGKLTLLGS